MSKRGHYWLCVQRKIQGVLRGKSTEEDRVQCNKRKPNLPYWTIIVIKYCPRGNIAACKETSFVIWLYNRSINSSVYSSFSMDSFQLRKFNNVNKVSSIEKNPSWSLDLSLVTRLCFDFCNWWRNYEVFIYKFCDNNQSALRIFGLLFSRCSETCKESTKFWCSNLPKLPITKGIENVLLRYLLVTLLSLDSN